MLKTTQLNFQILKICKSIDRDTQVILKEIVQLQRLWLPREQLSRNKMALATTECILTPLRPGQVAWLTRDVKIRFAMFWHAREWIKPLSQNTHLP